MWNVELNIAFSKDKTQMTKKSARIHLGKAMASKYISWRRPTILHGFSGCTLERHRPRDFVLGLLLTADMAFLPLWHTLMIHGQQHTLLGKFPANQRDDELS